MRAALVLMIGMVFWFMTPAIGEAHQAKQNNHDRSSYGQTHHDSRGYVSGFQHHDRHQPKVRKHHRHTEKRWVRQTRYQPPVRVVYRDIRPYYPLFPRIVINLPF